VLHGDVLRACLRGALESPCFGPRSLLRWAEDGVEAAIAQAAHVLS